MTTFGYRKCLITVLNGKHYLKESKKTQGGMGVSDKYRNNGRIPGDDDFDWESFDRKTSSYHPGENNSDPPLRRRRANGSAHKPAKHSAEGGQRARSESMRRANIQQGSTKKSGRRKRKKKQLTEKQIIFRKRLRISILAAVLVLVVICSGMFVGMYAAVSREIKDMNIQGLALNNSSFIYYTDANGNEQELDKIDSDSNRIWVDSSEISQYFKDAIVSIEDERFYQHHGVDLKRTFGATIGYIGSKIGIGHSNYGGSTITQQVIKNITNEDEITPTRKIKEMMRAIALENQLSKDEILTMYCNIVYFANNCNGVEAAARTYFNKSAADLNLQEAASIAGITQYPSEYDPLAHPDKNIEKRNTVLAKMNELGKITNEEYAVASASDLETSNAYTKEQSKATSYFVDQVINDVISDLMKQKGYSEDFATKQVYNGGLKIYSTVDVNVQGIMEDVFEDSSNFPGGDDAESAMVVLDPYTGQIKGLIGGLGEKTDIRGWNRATQAVRQPGSAIKPLSVYGPAVDMGKITEVDIVTDEEITIGSDKWKPKNSYSGFKGDMTIKEAVARSSNIPAVKVLDMIGLSNSFGYLQNKFHISTLQEEDKNYSSLSLGGLTQGVTVKEMAAAYGVFVNSGKYITPYTYTKVVDSTGNTILENYVNESQAISESAAYITADLLSGPVNMSYGTATKAKLSSGMPAYGKTGTTDKDFDKWFVGFTPYYVGAVWFGFDSPSSLSDADISGNPCVTAWKLVMDQISESQEYKELTVPSSVVECNVCSISGKLAGSSCDSVKAYFVDGTEPTEKCRNHYDRHQSDSFKTSEPDNKKNEATATPSSGSQSESSSDEGKTSSSGSSSSGSSSSGSSSSGSSSSGGATSGESSSGSSSSGSGSSGSSSSGGGSSSGESSSGGSSSGGGSSSSGESSSSGSSSSGGGTSGENSSGSGSADNVIEAE